MATCPPVKTDKNGHFEADRPGRLKGHEGCDFSTPLRTPLFTNVPMTITRIDTSSNSAGGRAVYMKDVNNREYYFAHLDAIPEDLKQGPIPVGTKFGTTGNSGVTETGKPHTTHLHFESWQNGKFAKTGVKVDPESYDPLTRKKYLDVATYEIDPVTKQPIGNLRTACRVPEDVGKRPGVDGPVPGKKPAVPGGKKPAVPGTPVPAPTTVQVPAQAPTGVPRDEKGVRIFNGNPLLPLHDGRRG